MFFFAATAICCTGLWGCSGIKGAQQALRLDKSYCHKQQEAAYTFADLPKPLHTLKIDTVLAQRFSPQSLNIANAIGILDMLTAYTKLHADTGSKTDVYKKLSLLELLLRINQKINLASLEVSATASELDCEEERASQFAYFLKEKEGKAENGLIISSIIVGAVGAVSSEIISNKISNAKAVSGFGIGIGLTEASLGALVFANKRKIEFYHTSNALADIWKNEPVSNYFPRAVWYYLTYEKPHGHEKSLAKLLVEKWFIFGQVAKEKKNSKNTAANLYFGLGGKYSADELKNRADMLDQTEAYVSLMKQDLKTLTRELDNLQQ